MSIHRDDIAVLAAIGLVWAGSVGYALAGQGLGLALGAGALVMAAAAAVASMGTGPGARAVVAALGMAMVALLIHVARGRTEAHFAVFAFMAVTVVYRRVLPVIAAAATIAVHHLSFNYFQAWGWGPVCFTEPSLMRVIEHALFVIAQAVVLVVMARRAAADERVSVQLQQIVDRLVTEDGSVDFSRIRVARPEPATKQLLDALDRVQSTVAQVRQGALEINNAAAEIANGTTDLSSRTEQSAGQLQKTASSVEELSGTVAQTAASAATASDWLSRSGRGRGTMRWARRRLASSSRDRSTASTAAMPYLTSPSEWMASMNFGLIAAARSIRRSLAKMSIIARPAAHEAGWAEYV